jgi:hypothetical protein
MIKKMPLTFLDVEMTQDTKAIFVSALLRHFANVLFLLLQNN